MKFTIRSVKGRCEENEKHTYEEIGFTAEKDWCDYWLDEFELEVNNLDELKAIQDALDEELIINFKDMTIRIYDGYNE